MLRFCPFYVFRNFPPSTVAWNDYNAAEAGAKIQETWQVFNENRIGLFTKNNKRCRFRAGKGTEVSLQYAWLPPFTDSRRQARQALAIFTIVLSLHNMSANSCTNMIFLKATFYHFFYIIMNDSESNLNWAWRRHKNNEVPLAWGSTSQAFVFSSHASFYYQFRSTSKLVIGLRVKHKPL